MGKEKQASFYTCVDLSSIEEKNTAFFPPDKQAWWKLPKDNLCQCNLCIWRLWEADQGVLWGQWRSAPWIVATEWWSYNHCFYILDLEEPLSQFEQLCSADHWKPWHCGKFLAIWYDFQVEILPWSNITSFLWRWRSVRWGNWPSCMEVMTRWRKRTGECNKALMIPHVDQSGRALATNMECVDCCHFGKQAC